MSSVGSVIVETESRVAHYLTATAFMVVGSTLVLGIVVGMNELSSAPDRQKVERTTAIEVIKQKKPKPKQQVQKPRPKPRKAPKTPPQPFLANMGSNLSGIAFDLPGLQFEDLGGGAKDLLTTEKDVVHTSETVDTPPQPVEQSPCEYPRRLRDGGTTGYVTLSVLLNTSGQAERVKVLESKPAGDFDQSALDCIRTWRFQPALYKGEAVSLWVRQTIRFKLATR